MKIEQYKNEVSSLKLSDSFKQNLKESMAKEFAAVAVTEIPLRPWTKYSKYIATAACLALIIATVGVVSLMGDGLKVEKSMDNAESEIMVEDKSNLGNNIKAEDVSTGMDPVPEEEESFDEIVEDVDDVPVSPSTEEDDALEDDAVIEEVDEVEEPEAAPISAYTPETYDGDYVTTDYVIGNNTSPEYSAKSISETVELLTSYEFSSTYEDKEDDVLEEDEVVEEDEEEVIEEVADEDPFYGDYKYNDSGISYSELSLDKLRYMDSVNFVKLTVKNVYSADEAFDITGDEAFLNSKTLYDINVTYDYLNSADLDLTLKLAAYGTSENQLVGRPVMEEGEKYAACLAFDNEGYVEMLEELTYSVHRINGLDIAYHLVGGSGVNPGDTHMGMLDIERAVITTTVNNPAQYTHKAALKELYRYLRRNWTREEYPFTDFSELDLESGSEQEEQVQEQIPEGPPVEKLKKTFAQGKIDITIDGVEFDPKGDGAIINEKFGDTSIGTGSSSSKSYINFKGAVIYFDNKTLFTGSMTEISLKTDCELPIKVNGVGIGDTMDMLVDAFNIGNYVDGKLTLHIASSTENGIAYTAKFEVVDNVIVDIEIK